MCARLKMQPVLKLYQFSRAVIEGCHCDAWMVSAVSHSYCCCNTTILNLNEASTLIWNKLSVTNAVE